MVPEHFIISLVVLRSDEVLSEHEGSSMATTTMVCESEKVEVLNIEVLNIIQQNDKSTQENKGFCVLFHS